MDAADVRALTVCFTFQNVTFLSFTNISKYFLKSTAEHSSLFTRAREDPFLGVSLIPGLLLCLPSAKDLSYYFVLMCLENPPPRAAEDCTCPLIISGYSELSSAFGRCDCIDAAKNYIRSFSSPPRWPR